MPDWQALEAALVEAGIRDLAGPPRPVGGGDIASAWRLDAGARPVFLKTMRPGEADVLTAEAEGLAEIEATGTVRTPRVLAAGATDDCAWLALEWLDMRGLSGPAGAELGRRLAAMHRHTRREHGWHRDNWIGRTPQRNTLTADWSAFFAEERLGYQLELAAARGFGGRLERRGRELIAALPEILAGHEPDASLLHGDIWGGNAASVDGEPVIFDPAVHYGDRECDLAMTRVFGGFDRAFYAAYDEAWPLDEGYRRREPLYQLYHVLNHLNLFGAGYLGRAEQLIDTLLP